jgi:uncharacterized membrane protein
LCGIRLEWRRGATVQLRRIGAPLSARLLAVALIVYVGVYTGLSAYKFDTLGQGFDLAENEQIIWNTANGRWFETSAFGTLKYDFDDGPVPFELLLAIPYRLFPSTYLLLFLQTVALAAGAIPLFALAREKINEWAALLFALAYLSHVTIVRMNMYEFQLRSFVIPFFLAAFLFFERRSFGLFLLFAVLALSCKSEVALTLPMFGVYAALTHRSWRWIVTPILIGVAWFVFVFYFVIPTFVPRDFITQVYGYSWLGNNMTEILTTLFTRPLYVAGNIFTRPKAEYLFQSLLLLLFLPILQPRLLIFALPNLVQNLLATRPVQYSVLYFYQPFVIAAFFLAAIYGIAVVVPRLMPNYARRAQIGIAGLLLIVSVIFNLTWQNLALRAIRNPETPARLAASSRILAQIPGNAAVAASSFLAPHLARRQELYFFPGDKSYPFMPERVQFVVVDLHTDSGPDARNKIATLRSDAAWKQVDGTGGYLLFERQQ